MTQPGGGGVAAMDWRAIQAAIMGSSFSADRQANGREGWDNLGSPNGALSDPNSLRSAANRFTELDSTLTQVRQRLRAEGGALTDADRWTGQGADSFDQRLRVIDRTIESYGQPLTGARSYPELLHRAAGALDTAIAAMQDINYQGALATKAEYERRVAEWRNAIQGSMTAPPPPPAQPWFATSNGSVVYTPSAYPEIDQRMTQQARVVMTTLTSEYRIVTGELRTPSAGGLPPTPNLALPEVPGLDAGLEAPDPAGAASPDVSGFGAPGLGPSGLDAPGLDAPGLGGAGGAGLPGLEAPDPSQPGAGGGPPGVGVPIVPGVPALPGAPAAPRPSTAPGLGVVPGSGVAPPGSGVRPGGAGGGPGPALLRPPRAPALAGSFPFAGGPAGPGTIASAAHAPIGPGGRPPGTSIAGPGGTGLGGLPYAPMMSPMAGGPGKDRERTTWLQEDRNIWGVSGADAVPRVITGPVEPAWDEAPYEEDRPRPARPPTPGASRYSQYSTTG